MFDLLKSFEAAAQDVARLQGLLLKAQAFNPNPRVQEQLRELHDAVGKALAEVREAMPSGRNHSC